MKHFSTLFQQIDETTKTKEKVSALKSYFKDAPPKDASWALYFLLGEKLSRIVSSTLLREWTAEFTELPLWMVEECYDTVGDLAETIALLIPEPKELVDRPLHELVEQTLLPLKELEEEQRKKKLFALWSTTSLKERFLMNKLLTGGLRVGVSKALVTRALSELYEFEEAEMAHRLTGKWEATEEKYQNLISHEYQVEGPGNPYPFFLAYPLEEKEITKTLQDLSEWQIEWKWDGIRAQLLKRSGQIMIWSRGEEAITESFPEIAEAMLHLPDNTVLDGELLAWKDGRPLSFGELQRRLGRKRIGKKLLSEVPAHFLAYDLLQYDGVDLREHSLEERRSRLESLFQGVSSPQFSLSEPLVPNSIAELKNLRTSAREQDTEGLMLKLKSSAYGVGRRKGSWWKWKVDPLTLDAVLLYAQKGHGRRADLYSDYTFGVWAGSELVTIAKAYSGLTDVEMKEVDRFIKQNTVERFGPVRSVTPELVFELGFDDIRNSTRHKSGFALRFPRMLRWRKDKQAGEADSIETVTALLKSVHG